MEEKKKNRILMTVIWIAVVAVLIVIDIISKYLISLNLEFGQKHDVIPGFFSLHHVVNTGSAFSFLADKSWGIYVLSAFSIIMGLALFALMIYTAGNGYKIMSFALSLLSAGAFGNLIDRIRLGHVIDFLRFDFGSYTFPIFNFADICAVCGTIIIISAGVFANKYFDGFINSIRKNKK
ncbi:MAG: signal peptidase II [Saccharofermentans sp.]|nr:signal peptidase II [Saccharofermentans sp.]